MPQAGHRIPLLDSGHRGLYGFAMNHGKSSPVDGIQIRDWSQMTAELVFLYDGEVHPEHLSLRGSFDDLSAVLIHEGEATLRTAEGTTRARRGDWVLAPQGERSQQFSAGSRVLSIHFLLSWPGRLPVYDWGRVLVVPSATVPEMAEAGRRMVEHVENHMGDARKVRYARKPIGDYFGLYRHFFDWMAWYGRVLASEGIHPIRLGKADSRALKAAQLLERRSFREPLLQAELASEVNLSVNQLVRVFRATFRMTPKVYMERRRAREAYLRVQNSKDSFKEIAYDLGFFSPAHFSTWFGRRFSHTPREVREHGHHLFPRQL